MNLQEWLQMSKDLTLIDGELGGVRYGIAVMGMAMGCGDGFEIGYGIALVKTSR